MCETEFVKPNMFACEKLVRVSVHCANSVNCANEIECIHCSCVNQKLKCAQLEKIVGWKSEKKNEVREFDFNHFSFAL